MNIKSIEQNLTNNMNEESIDEHLSKLQISKNSEYTINLNLKQKSLVLIHEDGRIEERPLKEGDEIKYRNCSICYNIPQNPKKNSCGHQACSSCWNIWFRRNRYCPRCCSKCGPSFIQ